MSKKHRKEHHEEHVDETWLIPYADLLTLLLALFIILFASSQVDSKKYDQIMRSLNSAFSGGTGFLDMSVSVPLEKKPQTETKKKDEESKTESQNQTQSQNQSQNQSQQQQQIEQQMRKEEKDMQELQQKIDSYIQANNLSTQLQTTLNQDMLMITIRDNALFASGAADVKPDAQKLAVAISDMLTQYPDYNVEVAGHTDNVPISNREFETNWDLSAKRALNFMKILMQNSQLSPARFRSIGYGEYQPQASNDTAEGRAKNRRVEVNIIRNLKKAEVKSVSNP